MRTFKQALFAGLVSAPLIAVGTAMAHDSAKLDSMKSPHGGQLRMAGPYHLELVPQANELLVYVTDHAGTKVPTRGVSGTATIVDAAGKVSILLKEARENVVRGRGTFKPQADATVS